MQETPLDRVLDVIAAASDSTAAGAIDDPDLPVAGTALIVRDGDAGPEVLLIQRPDRGSFGGAWVFPGGKVEASDREGLAVDATEEDVARRAAVRESLEETGLEIEPVVTLSQWDPPVGAKVRIRTWFFIARAIGGELAPSPDEVVGWEWVRPRDVLDRHATADVTLYPPTWVTLNALADASDSDALIARATFERFSTTARQAATGLMLVWQGDAAFETEGGAGAARHRLEVGVLPWVYTRSAG